MAHNLINFHVSTYNDIVPNLYRNYNVEAICLLATKQFVNYNNDNFFFSQKDTIQSIMSSVFCSHKNTDLF